MPRVHNQRPSVNRITAQAALALNVCKAENESLRCVVSTLLSNLREQRDTGLTTLSRDDLIALCVDALYKKSQ